MSKLKGLELIENNLKQAEKNKTRYQIKAVVSSKLNQEAISQARAENVDSISELLNTYIEAISRIKEITDIETLSELVQRLDELRGKVTISQPDNSEIAQKSIKEPSVIKSKPVVKESTQAALEGLMFN